VILDRHEAERLVAECDPLAWKLARKARRQSAGRGDLSDYHAAAVLGFWLAATRYDPARGAAFVTVAYKWARREVLMLARNEAARGIHTTFREAGRGSRFCIRRVDVAPFGLLADDDGRPFDVPDRIGRRCIDPAPFWMAVEGLMPDHRQRGAVLGYYRDGQDHRTIAAAHGIHPTAAGKRRMAGEAYLLAFGADRLAEFVA